MMTTGSPTRRDDVATDEESGQQPASDDEGRQLTWRVPAQAEGPMIDDQHPVSDDRADDEFHNLWGAFLDVLARGPTPGGVVGHGTGQDGAALTPYGPAVRSMHLDVQRADGTTGQVEFAAVVIAGRPCIVAHRFEGTSGDADQAEAIRAWREQLRTAGVFRP